MAHAHTFSRGRVEAPRPTMVKRTMMRVAVSRTRMVSADAKVPTLSCRLSASAYAIAPLRPGEREREVWGV